MEAKGGAGGGSRFRLREESPDRTPVPSLFKASAAPPPAPPPVSGPSSYADFVVQRAVAPPAPDPPKPVQVTPPNPEPGGVGGVGAELPPLPAIKPGAKSSSIIVSPRQRGNPVLRFVRNVPWEFGDVVPDYVLGQSTCALFLSLRYHHLHPDYIHERLRLLGRSYELRVLLLQVDVKDPLQALKDLAKVCILADCTLLLAWSPEEAGRYLETYKSYEQKPPDLLKERVEQDFLSRSLASLAAASPQDLSLCPGIGPQKAKRLFDALHAPFLPPPSPKTS
ncbi:DNA excision repair protein ERCC-1 isoform X6 [Phaenicophaeus curvirostris]|uniref:DNA excision repair protein ERCC-1 isoform X6 n=1 Tax=Phaenicophaeus curvirostris TaxID=33595 RepID=UPI0037F0FDDB